jgi:hypothetical protein
MMAHGGAQNTGGMMSSSHSNATTGAGGHGGMPSSSGDSGIMDALMDPVSDAMAGIENPQSGTRLKGKFTMGADGSKEYQYSSYFLAPNFNATGPLAVHAVWYDSMLQADCTFLPATDGQLHCLPGTPTSGGNGTQGTVLFFTDSACTQPIVALAQPGAGCVPYATPKYVQNVELNGQCAQLTVNKTHVYQVGSPAAQPAQVYYGDAAMCSAYNNNTNGFMAWFAATEVAPSAFVQGTTGTDP